MTRGWSVVLFAGIATAAVKAAAPLFFSGARQHSMPPLIQGALRRVPTAMFAALVVTSVFSNGQALTLDARVGGLLAAITGAVCRAPRLVTFIAAVVATAFLRHVWH